MKKVLIILTIIFSLFYNIDAQNSCDSIYVYHGKIKYGERGCDFSGFIDCNFHYRDTKKLPNIHRVVFSYTQHKWYSDKYDYIETVRAVGFVINGKEEGKWQYYNTDTDSLLVECYFVNGKLSGPLVIYNNKGETSTDYYVKGKIKGVNRRHIVQSKFHVKMNPPINY